MGTALLFSNIFVVLMQHPAPSFYFLLGEASEFCNQYPLPRNFLWPLRRSMKHFGRHKDSGRNRFLHDAYPPSNGTFIQFTSHWKKIIRYVYRIPVDWNMELLLEAVPLLILDTFIEWRDYIRPRNDKIFHISCASFVDPWVRISWFYLGEGEKLGWK